MKTIRIMTFAVGLISFLLISQVYAQGSHDSKVAQEPDTALTIISAQSVSDLAEISRRADSKRRKDRACEIQRSKKIAPSLCYSTGLEVSDSEKRRQELDSECRFQSLTATEIPKADEFTSAACREALETRSQDLAYAEKRNALR